MTDHHWHDGLSREALIAAYETVHRQLEHEKTVACALANQLKAYEQRDRELTEQIDLMALRSE